MKAKILLGLVFINIVFVAAYLVFQSTPVAAGNNANTTQTSARQEQQPTMQPLTLSPSDQMEIIRQKEERLKTREMEIKELEKQLQEKIKSLEVIEASIKNDLNSYKVINSDRIKQLVKIYSSMKPNAAATLMNNIEANVAVQVFIGMKGDIAGGILSYMEPIKAAGITQKLVSYRGGNNASTEPAPAGQ
jgi:flagellar motility protein MotE (MotC chaperone)